MTTGTLSNRVVRVPTLRLYPAAATGYRGDVVAICALGTLTGWTDATMFQVRATNGAALAAVAPWAVGGPTVAAWGFEIGTVGGTLTISDGQVSAIFQLQVLVP